ncbi:hypothetical protein ACB092_11G014600 [Castanea dentata]
MERVRNRTVSAPKTWSLYLPNEYNLVKRNCGHLRNIFGCRGLYWGIKIVKSVKKDVKSRVESKGLYWGTKVVFVDFLLYCMRLKDVNLKDSMFRPLDVVNLVELLLASPRKYSILIFSLALIVWSRQCFC